MNTWIELNENLFVWMKWEKIGMTILLLLIVMVGALNIISALIMVVMEKRREIGVLRTSMGATRGSVMRIFMLEGLFIGLVGTIAGSLLGYPWRSSSTATSSSTSPGTSTSLRRSP